MKKQLLSALLLAGTTATFAQQTLTATDMTPAIGNSFLNVNCDTFNIQPGAAGNQTWNFAGLLNTSTGPINDTTTAVSVASTGLASLYSAANIATNSTATGAKIFLITSATKLQLNGYFQSATQNAVFSDPIDQFHFPVTYLDSFTDTYAGAVTFTASSTTVTATEAGNVKVVCDGWGTLKLPGGVTDTGVLRFHSSQVFRDSALLFGLPMVANFVLNTYSWYKKGYHAPLLTIMTSDQVGGGIRTKTVTYAKKNTVSLNDVSRLDESLALYPNPASNELKVRFESVNNSPVTISLTDLTGRTVASVAQTATQGIQSVNFDVSSLAKGLYFVQLQSAEETVSRKVTIQ
ncbi:MAG: T9SS type A sorting domain-containing protein [Taibaiella sp.]|nr:T9SS type A sorting domain-containing protein [Taibaiella sp.]